MHGQVKEEEECAGISVGVMHHVNIHLIIIVSTIIIHFYLLNSLGLRLTWTILCNGMCFWGGLWDT